MKKKEQKGNDYIMNYDDEEKHNRLSINDHAISMTLFMSQAKHWTLKIGIYLFSLLFLVWLYYGVQVIQKYEY